MNVDPIAHTLKNNGFCIVPDSVFDEIKSELEKEDVPTDCLYKQSEKEFTDVVDFGENDPKKKFASVRTKDGDRLIRK